MKKLVLGLVAATLSYSALAQNIESQTVKAGDSWTYRITTEKAPNGWRQQRNDLNVTRVTGTSIYYTLKESGSTQTPTELFSSNDWGLFKNLNGKETLTQRPLEFPLSTGKTWKVEYTEQHPNKRHKFEKWEVTYKVIGYETVEVPAGKFKAMKIEAEGNWSAELEPMQTVVQTAQSERNETAASTKVDKVTSTQTTGRIYKAFWYVPEVKRWVKSVEEYYSSGGVRDSSYASELESFKLAE
jgi:hypothetical protein